MDGGDDFDRNDRLDRAMAEFFAAEDAREPLSPEDWLERHPDIRSELIAFLADHSGMRRLVDPGPRPADGVGGGPPPASPLVWQAAGEDDFRSSAMPDGSRVKYFGDYELIGVLGRGGMGIVYKARQISLGRYVALKMIRNDRLAEDEDLRRFWIEAETVARLEHPGVLPILEIGKHDGRHYFSMPVVVGGSLAAHLPRYLEDPEAAARVILAAAEAIHHAHQRGILHRDLKPSNILIDAEGLPRVNDFGLAKRLDEDGNAAGLTPAGAILGTPSYMAPEQAGGDEGDITTAVDVYGLGAVLYAMLTGRPPFFGTPLLETLRQVREAPPEPPRRLNRRVGRGLEKICLKCLEKDPKRRYASAAALAEDLRRWGRGEPVEARPSGRMVRFALWCRRRPAVAALTGLLAATILGGAIAVAIERHEAGLQRKVSRRVDEFFRMAFLGYRDPMGFAYKASAPVGGSMPIEGLLDRIVARLDAGELADLPAADAGVRQTIGNTYRAMGRPSKAAAQLSRSLGLRRSALGGGAIETLEAEAMLASLLTEAGRVAEAGPLARHACEWAARVAGPGHLSSRNALATLADWQLAAGEYREAERSYGSAIGSGASSTDAERSLVLHARGGLGLTAQRSGRLDEARGLLGSVLDERKSSLPRGHPLTLNASNALAANMISRGDFGGAEALLDESHRAAILDGSASGPEGQRLRANLAALRFLQWLDKGDESKLGEARAIAGEIVAARQTGGGGEDSDLVAFVSASNTLASVYFRLDRPDEAQPLLRDALKIRRETLGDRHPETAAAICQLAETLAETSKSGDDVKEAVNLMSQALPCYCAIAEGDGPPNMPRANHPLTGTPAELAELGRVLSIYGNCLLKARDGRRAEAVLKLAKDARSKALKTGDWRLANTRSLYGGALWLLGQAEDARKYTREAYEDLERLGAPPSRIAQAKGRLDETLSAPPPRVGPTGRSVSNSMQKEASDAPR